MASIFNKSLQQYLHVNTGPIEPKSRINVLNAVDDILFVVGFKSLLLKLCVSFSSVAAVGIEGRLALLMNEVFCLVKDWDNSSDWTIIWSSSSSSLFWFNDLLLFRDSFWNSNSSFVSSSSLQSFRVCFKRFTVLMIKWNNAYNSCRLTHLLLALQILRLLYSNLNPYRKWHRS